MKYLKFHLISTFFISFCFILAACGVTKQEMAVTINLAGKQRMLTQKMSKEILLIAKGINVIENQNNLRQTAILFNRTLIGLFNGDSELGLVQTKNPHIIQQLNQVAEWWKEFRENVDTVLMGNMSIAVLNKTAQQNISLLREMNKVVKMYERGSSSNLAPSMAVPPLPITQRTKIIMMNGKINRLDRAVELRRGTGYSESLGNKMSSS